MRSAVAAGLIGLMLSLGPLPGAAPAMAQEAARAVPQDAAGRWALRAGDRPIAILELQRDAVTGGWTGAWIRPDQMAISQMHAVFDVGGPVVRRRLLAVVPRENLLELTIEGRAGSGPGRMFFRMIDSNHAELGWIDPLAIPPIPLVRAGPEAVVAADWVKGSSYPITTPRPNNAEVAALFAADQAARSGTAIDWAVVGPEDAKRRERARALLAEGALRSGTDFFHAAFIFQHGDKPDDYLMAHTLAVVAAARGRSDATWIAAATLDRYLQDIGQPQIYGTQYTTRGGPGWNQEPYDRALISDALRNALGVPALAQQAERVREMEEKRRAQESPPKP